MNSLYITADTVNKNNHGAGTVTRNELAALMSISEHCFTFDKTTIHSYSNFTPDEEPWACDSFFNFQLNFTNFLNAIFFISN